MTTLGEKVLCDQLVVSTLGSDSQHVDHAVVRDLYTSRQRLLTTSQVTTKTGHATVSFMCTAPHNLIQ